MKFVDMPIDTQLVPLTQIAARFNLSERAMKDRLKAFNVPIVKPGRVPSVFVADLARLIAKMKEPRKPDGRKYYV